MRQLKYLALLFVCSNYDRLLPKESESTILLTHRGAGRWAPSSVVREALINAAIDSHLAETIFRLVRGPGSRLEYLKLQKIENGCICSPNMGAWIDKHLMMWMARKWEVVVDYEGNYVVQEIFDKERLDYEPYMPVIESDDIKAIWESIWPVGENGELEWRSLPLQRQENRNLLIGSETSFKYYLNMLSLLQLPRRASGIYCQGINTTSQITRGAIRSRSRHLQPQQWRQPRKHAASRPEQHFQWLLSTRHPEFLLPRTL